MNEPNEPSVFLDVYDGENMQTVWCWKNDATSEASQEFSSEEEALAAWKNDDLTWSTLNNLGE
jgi:hypothetical protein